MSRPSLAGLLFETAACTSTALALILALTGTRWHSLTLVDTAIETARCNLVPVALPPLIQHRQSITCNARSPLCAILKLYLLASSP